MGACDPEASYNITLPAACISVGAWSKRVERGDDLGLKEPSVNIIASSMGKEVSRYAE